MLSIKKFEVTRLSYLQCRQIQKTYGSVVALADATLSVEKGEIRALLGGNGSGKSTLAKIIGCAAYADGGDIWFDGKRVDITSPIRARAAGIISTSQELSLFNHLTVEENLMMTNAPRVMRIFRNKKKSSETADKYLRKFGLEGFRKHKVQTLSDDQKYLVEFAKAIMTEPKLLIIDEITSALYREEVDLVKETLVELAAEGCTILFISHRMQEIYAICSSVTVMRNGRVINTHPLGSVTEEALLDEMIGVDRSAQSLAAGSDSGSDCAMDVPQQPFLVEATGLRLSGSRQSMNIEIKKGEMIGVAGLQGQGQSRLLRTLFGLEGPITVNIDGTARKIDSPLSAIRQGFAYLSGDRQKEGVFNGRTISENLEVVNYQVLRHGLFSEAELLAQFGVKYDSASQEIQTLSGGNQQKVVIARWVGTKPKLLLADDPTKGIDVGARRDVHRIFRDLVSDGASVIMSSSDDEELVQISEVVENYKVIVVYGGQIVAVLQGEDLTVSNIIASSIPRGANHEHH